MNLKNTNSTQKNLRQEKPILLHEILNPSNNLLYDKFVNLGGLRKSGLYKSSAPGKPLISVITVSYNSEKTIENTIKSVLNQTYDNIEYIVIDGNSQDSTLKIIKKYDTSIDLWISESDSGIYNAINKGLKMSSGDIIGILNSDDTYTKDALSLVKKYFEKFDGVDLVFGSIIKERLFSGFKKEKIRWKFNIYPGHSSGFFISKNAQLKAGLYDEKFELHADYDLIYRLVCKFKMKSIAMDRKDVTGKFNIYGKSSKENQIRYYIEEFKIRKKNKQSIFFISLLLIIKIIYFYLFKIPFLKKIFFFLRSKINY